MTYEARSITGNKYYPEPDCCIETLLSSLGAVTQTFLGLISGRILMECWDGMMHHKYTAQVHILVVPAKPDREAALDTSWH